MGNRHATPGQRLGESLLHPVARADGDKLDRAMRDRARDVRGEFQAPETKPT
ncbi:MAG: hypothetical protein Q8N07_02290 [Rhodocyclaceae bacterium]|nr:hypothetical protein [Rhodocyclaceae bacterium]